MESKFYNNKSDKLILVFAGWGCDENVFSHLKSTQYDVVICYNYTRIKPDGCQEFNCSQELANGKCPIYSTFNRYSEINIVAWGAGVWMASLTFELYFHHLKQYGKFKILRLLKKIKRCVAINGTLFPISNTWGLSQRMFNNTLTGFRDDVANNCTTETSQRLEKFTRKMCGTSTIYKRYMSQRPKRGLEDMLNELVSIKENFTVSNAVIWNRVIIGANDTIIPANHQTRFWTEYDLGTDRTNRIVASSEGFRIEYIDAPHYPFFMWSSWDEIVEAMENNCREGEE